MATEAKTRYWITQIMRIGKCDVSKAEMIEEYIDENIDLEWSEATERQLRLAVMEAKKNL